MGSGGGPDPQSASRSLPSSQLQQETQASRCCLLLVSEDNLQLSCKVRNQVYCDAGRGTRVSEGKNFAHPLMSLHCSLPQVIGDKVLEEEISFPVSHASVPRVGVCRSMGGKLGTPGICPEGLGSAKLSWTLVELSGSYDLIRNVMREIAYNLQRGLLGTSSLLLEYFQFGFLESFKINKNL